LTPALTTAVWAVIRLVCAVLRLFWAVTRAACRSEKNLNNYSHYR
jgi:hypothetical protein